MILTYNLNLAKVTFNLQIKYQSIDTGTLIFVFAYFASRHDECQYLEALEQIIKHGIEKGDRTGVGTRSIFGMQFRYSLRDGKCY